MLVDLALIAAALVAIAWALTATRTRTLDRLVLNHQRAVDIIDEAHQDIIGIAERFRDEMEAQNKSARRYRDCLQQIEHRARNSVGTIQREETNDELLQIATMARNAINVGRKVPL